MCFDYFLMFLVPYLCCVKILDAMIMISVLLLNLLVRGYLYFGIKVGVFELISHIAIPIMLCSIVCATEIQHHFATIQDLHTEMTVKNDEF